MRHAFRTLGFFGAGLMLLLTSAILGLLPRGTAFGAVSYQVVRSSSYLVAITDKAGLFGFAGHRHAVVATDWSVTESIDPANWTASSITITVPASELVIDSPEARKIARLGSGPNPDDVRTIQEKMLGPEVLDARQYPSIQFRSMSVAPKGSEELLLTGQVQIRGRSQEVQVPVRLMRVGNDRIQFSGRFTIKQTDFGIEPASGGLGTVKVKDEIQIQFRITLAPAR
jgi:polyisoprenoid-binding protein YceI